VWVAEGFNTAIERLADAISIERNDHIRFAKDVAAGAVLVALVAAALIVLTVFGPRLVELLG
jgi:diacylglycerol kinase